MRERIENILSEIIPGVDLKCETLIDSGYIQSLDLISIISELDIEFDIEITYEDLDISNFNSVDAIQALVEKKVQIYGHKKK